MVIASHRRSKYKSRCINRVINNNKMSLNYTFSGKKVLITGGGRGIGRQLVQRLYDDGAKVFTIDKDLETITQLRKELPNVTAVQVDITDWDATKAAIESFGPMDHLVKNAGIMLPQKFLEITKEMANLHFDVNIIAPINITQTVAKGMIAQGNGGSIVNICSIAGRVAMEAISPYCASKAALESMTRSMALELGPYNIRVNCVLPGMVLTPMVTDVSPPDVFEQFVKPRVIVKRVIKTDEVADLVLYLLSPLSSMMTGSGVVIDGGSTVT